MNSWYTAGLLAAEHRADLDREVAGDELRKLAHGVVEPHPGAHIPRSGGTRHSLASMWTTMGERLGGHLGAGHHSNQLRPLHRHR